MSFRTPITPALVFAFAVFSAAAIAQTQGEPKPPAVVKKCLETVANMPGLGSQSTSNDFVRDRAVEACEANNGQVAGETIGGAPLTNPPAKGTDSGGPSSK